MPARRPQQGRVQSLVRALGILNRLAEAEDGASLTELAQQVGLAPSTAHRLLSTLQAERYVRFDPERTRWSVGVQAFAVGGAFLKARNLTELARPHMQALMEASGETVALAVEDEGEAIFLAQIECRQTVRALSAPGARAPLHASGAGKALLAAMPDSRIGRILQRHGLPRLTGRTIANPAALREDLARVARQGFAVDDEEQAFGLRSVGAVVRDEVGEAVAALCVAGPTSRLSADRLPVVGDLVRRAAAAIAQAFGGGRAEAA